MINLYFIKIFKQAFTSSSLYTIVWDLDVIYDKIVSINDVNDFIDNEINLSVRPWLQLINDRVPNTIILIFGMISFDNSENKFQELKSDKIILLNERINICFNSIINKNISDNEKINKSCCLFICLNDNIKDTECCGIVEFESQKVLFNNLTKCIRPFIDRQIDFIKNIKEIYIEKEKNISIDIKDSINSSIKKLKENKRLFATIDELQIQADSNQNEQCISYIKLLSNIDQV